ncbi:MAG: hypothetical protein ABI983_05085 [Acidobacteriota bacterium]
MTDPNAITTADQLGRRRARMLPVIALFFLMQQTSFFANPPAERAVDHVRIGAWVLMTAVILLLLQTGGSWFRSPAVRAMMEDEPTRANRASALHWGFLAMVLSGMTLYSILGVAPMTAREVIHLVVSAGIIVALLRFGILERRAYE